MIILLRAELSRLFKSKELYLLMAFMALFTILRLYLVLTDPMNQFETGFFSYILFIGILLAVFISLFVGSEYHYGTLRNKLIIGHTRQSIYLVELFVCMTAGWLFCLVPILINTCAGFFLLGAPNMNPLDMVFTVLGSLLLSSVYCSLLVLLALLCSSRTKTALIGLLSAIALLIIGFGVCNALLEPETYSVFDFSASSEENPTEKILENPHYLKPGPKRSFYSFLNDFLPGGQTIQLSQFLEGRRRPTALMMLYDVTWFLIGTGSGILLFQKKDLK